MLPRIRLLLCCVAALVFFGPDIDLRSSGGDELPKVKSAVQRQAALERDGYVGIPFLQWNSGYLVVEARVDGKRLNLILDTGAPQSHLDPGRTKNMGLKWFGAKDEANCWIGSLQVGPIATGRMLISDTDLSSVNRALTNNGNPAADGLLGADVLVPFQAVIDYPNRKLYLLKTASEKKVVVGRNPERDPPKTRLCQVGFWNLTGRQVALTVEGRSVKLAKNGAVRMDLEREFAWQMDGGPLNTVRVAAEEQQHEVVIR